MTKGIFLFFVLFCAFIFTTQAQPIAPMSDSYGYVYRTDTSSPAIKCSDLNIDPASITNRVDGLGDDNVAGPINIGFEFQYYWSKYSTIYLGTNGYAMFGGITNIASTAGGFPPFPSSTGNRLINNYIGMFLCDLTFTDLDGQPVPGASIRYQTFGDSLFALLYENVPFWVREEEDPKGYAGSNTFMLILHKNSGDISIKYLKQEGEVSTAYQGAQVPISIGMENISGEVGIQFWGKTGAYPPAGSCLRVFRPLTSEYRVSDAQVEWVLNDNSYARMIPITNATNVNDVTAKVSNSGTVAITGIKAIRSILDPLNTTEVPGTRDTFELGELQPGASEVITFNSKVTRFSDQGFYPVRVELKFADPDDDAVFVNNTARSLIVITDEPTRSQVVGYESNILQDERLDTNAIEFLPDRFDISGRFKVGTYFEPPFRPAELNDLFVGTFITRNFGPDTLLGFICKIFDDNGPNGGPGTLLRTVTLTAEDMAQLYTDEDPLPGMLNLFYFIKRKVEPALVIEEGGVYVSWEQPNVEGITTHSDFLLLDQDRLYTKSNRLFEISGGLWAPHRERPFRDMLVKYGIKTPDGRNEDHLALKLNNPYPNPADDMLNVPIDVKSTTPVQVRITDQLGRTVYQNASGNFMPGKHILEVPTQTMIPGVYSCTLVIGGDSVTRTFIISR